MPEHTIFGIESPAPACSRPSKAHPNGRTGTTAGYNAHRKEAAEKPCESCAEANREYDRVQYQRNRERILAGKQKHYRDNIEEKRSYDKDYRQKNREKLSRKNREYYMENAEMIRERQKGYNRENIEKVRETKRAYRESNRDRYAEWGRKYHAENPEIGRLARARRRAMQSNLPSDGYSLENITQTHGIVCYLCGDEVDVTLPRGSAESPEVDHVHPISRMGCPGDILDNVRWTHAVCNRTKKDRKVSELNLPFPSPPQSQKTAGSTNAQS